MVTHTETKIRTVCSWCKSVILDVPPGPGGEISHGICKACIPQLKDQGFSDEDIEYFLSDEPEENPGDEEDNLGIKGNPSHYQGIADLAEEGRGTFEDFIELYPATAAGEIEVSQRDMYYGRNVIWVGDHGRMVRVNKNNIEHIWGNMFDPDKLAAIVDGIKMAEDRVVFYAPYGDASMVEVLDIKESIEAHARGDDDGMDEPLSTGDAALDDYIVDPEEFTTNEIGYIEDDQESEKEERAVRKKMDKLVKQAEKENWGDLGTLRFQVRDGNHRAFGALIAGEPYIYMIISDNQMQDLKDKRIRRTRWAQAIIKALE